MIVMKLKTKIMSKVTTVNTSSIVCKVLAFCQILYSNSVSWVCRGLAPSSPTLLPVEKGVVTVQSLSVLSPSVLSPSPRRRGTKGEVTIPKREVIMHTADCTTHYYKTITKKHA